MRNAKKNGEEKISIVQSRRSNRVRIKSVTTGVGWIKQDQAELTGSYCLGGVGMDRWFL